MVVGFVLSCGQCVQDRCRCLVTIPACADQQGVVCCVLFVLQRSIAFAKHFASFTRVFRDVQRQQQLKQGADQEQQQEGGQQQQHQAVAQPTGHPASTQHDAADGFSNTASGSHLDSTAINLDNSNADDVLDAAVAAAVAPDAAALHAAAAAASDPAGPAGGASGGNTRMERTISVLDQLLGEQLTEQAAAGK